MIGESPELPNFEEALAELEQLVDLLESGNLSLDESLANFRRGVELTRHCQSVLDRAQQMVEVLAGQGEPSPVDGHD